MLVYGAYIKHELLQDFQQLVLPMKLEKIYRNRATQYSNVISCVVSIKSKKFEFEDEPPKNSQITGQKSEKNVNNIFYQ